MSLRNFKCSTNSNTSNYAEAYILSKHCEVSFEQEPSGLSKSTAPGVQPNMTTNAESY